MTTYRKPLCSRRLWPVAVGLLLVLVVHTRAAIPAAALADPRAPLGYLVVTYYGADPTGVADSTSAIQAAIDDAQDNYYAVFFPAGTYKISDTIRCFNWQLWDTANNRSKSPHQKSPALVGSKLGASRPKIVLESGASGFGDAANAKPMIAYRNIEATDSNGTAEVSVPNAFVAPAHFKFNGGNCFAYNLCNLDFDCNGNTGAVGVAFDGAQNCTIQNVKVFATGAFGGFVDLPGPGGVSNIEVEGGLYGVVMGSVTGVSNSWVSTVTTIAGLKLQNQTDAALVVDNYNGAVNVVGFYIKPASTGDALQISTSSVTSRGTFVLLDGVIDMVNHSSAYAVDNSAGKSCVLRNVYVTNTGNLIQSVALTTSGTGTWKQIVEYAYTDQHAPASGDPPYDQNDTRFETYSIIDGTSSKTTAEPVKNIVNSAAAPLVDDLILRHTWLELPSFEDGATGGSVVGVFENPLDYGATPETDTAIFAEPNGDSIADPNDDGAADTVAFQAAIEAATAAGHGRVVIPRGVFHLSEAAAGGYALTLHANTKLFGASLQASKLAIHASWQPTSGMPVMIQTDDDAFASTYFGFAQLYIRRLGGTLSGGVYPQDRFSQLLWRAGRNSMTVNWQPYQQYVADYASNPRYNMKFIGHGGGRHHGFATPGRGTGGTGFRGLIFDGTTEPVWFYTANVEATKSGGGVTTDMNIEIDGAQNIRLIGLKREGLPAPTAKITDSTNVGLFGHEVYQTPGSAGDLQITGTSDNVLIGVSNARGKLAANDGPLLKETITGHSAVSLDWPRAISIYKRGSLDDAKMIISPGLPGSWLSADIGAVGATGIARYDTATGTFAIVGSGANVWAGADEFQFVHQAWNGDATIIAKVTSITNTNTYAKAGIMIRHGLGASIAHAAVNITPGGRVEFLRRATDGNTTTDNTFVTDATMPKWLKLVRAGDSVSAYYSNNGSSWTQVGSAASVSLGSSSVEAGVFVCATNDGALNTSTFTEVSVTGVGSFNSQDIGSPGVAGSASLSSGVYTVAGGGADIYGSSDQFRFVHQPWTGDAQIIARVASVQNTYGYAKAGVMFRDDTTAGAANVNLALMPVGATQYLRRFTAGGSTTGDTESFTFNAPYWLRLERHGNVFTGWQSPDGIGWWFTGADTVALNNTALVGLAVTAHNNSLLNTSTFDNVSVTAAPIFTAADVGTVNTAGTTTVNHLTGVTTIDASGANIYGTADAFHFYFQPWSGDATLIAMITSVENTSIYAKAGVMIRQSLDADAVQATAAISVGNGAEFLRRTSTGGTTTNTTSTTPAPVFPRWVKLVRSGNSISAYHSVDGGTWTQIGTTQTMTMTGTVYVGLASCSIIDTSNVCASTIEGFFVK